MHIKAKTLHFIYAKKLKIVQIQEKSLWCILNNKYLSVKANIKIHVSLDTFCIYRKVKK